MNQEGTDQAITEVFLSLKSVSQRSPLMSSITAR